MALTERRTFLGLAAATAAGIGLYSATDLLGKDAARGATLLSGPAQPKFTTLTPFVDPLRIPPVLRPRTEGVMEIEMVARRIRLHSQLPPSPMWTYMGHYPGPTIEVPHGQHTRVAWTNRLDGTMPVKAVFAAPSGPPPGISTYNEPGSKGTTPRPEIDQLRAWTSVHLHGGHQFGTSDGPADSGVTHGGSQFVEYTNATAGAHLFYHDHAMPVTALNVLSGLMGQYLIRDEQERHLGLPKGDYEIPLVLSDVNFDTDSAGRLSGKILAKKIAFAPGTPDTLPPSAGFLGPYTMVNGVVWPHLKVEPRAYRFRVINIALARSYRLVVIDEKTGAVVRGAMKVIGTDLGLLAKPQVIDEALSLLPAERADIVIDFAAHPGKRLKLVNTVPGVPAGTPVPPAAMQYPDVMQFRVGTRAKSTPKVPATLSRSFKRITAQDVPADAVERFVMLSMDKTGGMPQLWELSEVASDTTPGDGIVQFNVSGSVRTFRRVATMFEDTTSIFVESGSWEKWTIFNVAPPNVPIYHPIHIHMIDFQLLERNALDGSGMDFAAGHTTKPITALGSIPISPEESGWKDTVAVPANTMVTIAGRFGQQAGRFMYHCHLLDHEDEGMMRPIVVYPPSVLKIHHMIAGMGDGGMTMKMKK